MVFRAYQIHNRKLFCGAGCVNTNQVETAVKVVISAVLLASYISKYTKLKQKTFESCVQLPPQSTYDKVND